jgi:hypothetical protein
VKDYKINRAGIRKMMTSDPQLHRALFTSARQVLSIARANINDKTGELAASGRVEDRGIKGVQRGERRMTVAVAFYARHAAAYEARTGFLSRAAGRGRKTPGGDL